MYRRAAGKRSAHRATDDTLSTILVTGGAGFIGSALVRMIVRDTDHVVVNVDKLTYAGNLESLPGIDEGSRYHFHRLDICDGAAIGELLAAAHPDAIVHLAAESHVDRSIDGPADFVNTNVVGTFALLQQALSYWRSAPAAERDRFRFVHVSTAGAERQ